MGHLLYRFTLKNLNTLETKSISEPEGWRDIRLVLERDKDYHGITELVETPFIFYGQNGEYDGGFDWLETQDENEGVDALIQIQIDISPTSGSSFENLFTGVFDWQSRVKRDDRKLEFVIVPSDFWAIFKNRESTPVDIQSTSNIDGESIAQVSPLTIALTGQKIRQIFKSTLKNGVALFGTEAGYPYGCQTWPPWESYSVGMYINFGADDVEIDEIEDSIIQSIYISDTRPDPRWVMKYDGNFVLDAYIGMSLYYSTPNYDDPPTYTSYWDYTSPYIGWYIQVNDDPPLSFTHNDFNTPDLHTRYDKDISLDLKKGDVVRIYGKVLSDTFSYPFPPEELYETFFGIFGENGIDHCDGSHAYDKIDGPASTRVTSIHVTADTLYADTEAEGFLLHDVGESILNRITPHGSTPHNFYSEYLGGSMSSIVYGEDGCGYPNVLVRGLQIRQYTLSEKPFSISFKQWWEGANPILNLGLQLDEVDGNAVVRVEEKEFFYDNDTSLTLSWINNPEEKYDKDNVFRNVKIGYKKWQSEEGSSIDDPQTNRSYSTKLKVAGIEITIQSDFIAAGIAIENTRRKEKEKSADYRYDNDTFIIAAKYSDGWYPELDENFNSISNLINADTRYNLRLTPARNLLRWSNILFGCLQKNIHTNLKFSSGEGNFDMESDMISNSCNDDFDSEPLSEKQDIPVTTGYLFQPVLITFKHPLPYSDYLAIRSNRNKAILISTSDEDHLTSFIKRLEYDINKSVATFTVWIK